jgi:hypothetical protein
MTAVRALRIAVVALLAAALIALASLPTGAGSATATVPDGRRVAASTPVGGVRVMVVSRGERLSLHIAYRGEKGWHGVQVDPAPSGSAAVWSATKGSDDVPALSAVYGRATGRRVRVQWADGQSATVDAATDGAYLAVRSGRVSSRKVEVLGDDGAVLSSVDGP